ncbi:hypothetical protein [uncultured Campylobacter sp.]|uniref:hypothetical protein n=2 Tax=uncultured Campylobacter sp. TaxID=218934 RepID=UPI00262C5F63|nr:hypothetical protein [uncultured Campylobacter sp.]
MKFIKIYAASVRETMGWARRRPARRKALTADLSRRILSASVSKRGFERGISNAQILKGEILNGEFLELNFKSRSESSETGLPNAASS